MFKKEKIVSETKTLANHSRYLDKNEEVKIQNRTFIVHPKVFHPGVFFSSNWFAEQIATLVKNESHFCEVGCGTGVVVITTAIENPDLQVVAVDINEQAVENTKENAVFHGVDNRVSVLHSDVLDAITPSRQFDSIFWAMPFGYLDENETVDIIDLQTFDPGYQAIEKFFKTAKYYLKENGRLLVGFSEEIGTRELLDELIEKYGFTAKLLVKEEGLEKSVVTMEILEVRSKE